jgi:hypothetical protein
VRLSNVESGGGLGKKLLFAVIRMMSGYRAPDVVRTLQYRSDFFGAAHSAHTQEVMRGQSDWSVGERELFAAWVSHLNQCRF